MNKLYFVFISFFGLVLHAQTPSIDPSFNTSDNGYYRENAGKKGVVLSDGKILALYTPNYDFSDKYVTRLNPDGGVDNTFIMSPNLQNYDSKIYARADGSFATLSGSVIRKFDASGLLLATYNYTVTNSDTSESVRVNNLYYLPNGKIIAFGEFDAINGVSKNNIVQLDTDGSIDDSFNIGTGFNNETFFMEITSDGKYLVAGDFGNYNGVTKSKLAKLNTDGSLDSTFGITGLVNRLNDIKILSDGKILVAGCNYKPAGFVLSRMLTRLNANGTRDASFAVTTNYDFYFETIEVQTDGKILYNDNAVVKRLNANGTPDATFANTNLNMWISGYALGQEGNLYMQGNKILVTSDYKNAQGITRMGIHRLNSDGTIDLTFNPSRGPNVKWHTMVTTQSNSNTDYISVNSLLDQKILAIGRFSAYQDIPCRQMCRLTVDGLFDPTFILDPAVTIGDSYWINEAQFLVRQQSDGKIIIVSKVPSYMTVNNEERSIIRLNSNGSLDTSFNFSGISNYIIDIELVNDKFLLSGYGNTFIQNSNYVLRRINNNGSLDATFNSSVTFADPPKIEMQPDGKILAAGESLKRLNSNGTLDNTFNPDLLFKEYVTAKILATGKIIVGYIVGSLDLDFIIKRLNADGSEDGSFVPYNFDETETDQNLRITADDYILLNRTKQSGDHSSNMVLLNTFGTEVAAFANHSAGEQVIGHFAVQDCESLIYYGNYNVVDGVNKNSLIRYNLGDFVQAPTGELYQNFTNGQVLNDLVISGQNILWFDQQGGCSINTDRNLETVNAILPETTPLVNGTTYYASQTVGGIESNYRLPVTVSLSLGVNNNELKNFEAYPNPVDNMLHVSGSTMINTVKIFNTLGQEVLTYSISSTESEIDFSPLQSGIYLVKINTENQSQTLKIVKK